MEQLLLGLVDQGPLVAFFILLVGGLLRGHLVPGRELSEMREQRDRWEEEARRWIALAQDTLEVTERTVRREHDR